MKTNWLSYRKNDNSLSIRLLSYLPPSNAYHNLGRLLGTESTAPISITINSLMHTFKKEANSIKPRSPLVLLHIGSLFVGERGIFIWTHSCNDSREVRLPTKYDPDVLQVSPFVRSFHSRAALQNWDAFTRRIFRSVCGRIPQCWNRMSDFRMTICTNAHATCVLSDLHMLIAANRVESHYEQSQISYSSFLCPWLSIIPSQVCRFSIPFLVSPSWRCATLLILQ